MAQTLHELLLLFQIVIVRMPNRPQAPAPTEAVAPAPTRHQQADVPEESALSLEEPADEGTVTLTSLADGKAFSVSKKDALLSALLRNALEGDPNATSVPIPKHVGSAVLQQVAGYLTNHQGSQVPALATPLRDSNFHNLASEFDAKLMNFCDENHLLYGIIHAANYMMIPPLLDLALAKLASRIKEAPLEEIRGILEFQAGHVCSRLFSSVLVCVCVLCVCVVCCVLCVVCCGCVLRAYAGTHHTCVPSLCSGESVERMESKAFASALRPVSSKDVRTRVRTRFESVPDPGWLALGCVVSVWMPTCVCVCVCVCVRGMAACGSAYVACL